MRTYIILALAVLGLLVFGCTIPGISGDPTNTTANATETNMTNTTKVCADYDYAQPVCGEDGITYENDCVAAKSGVLIEYDGECITCTAPSNVCIGNNAIQFRCDGNELKNTTVACLGDSACENGDCVKKEIPATKAACTDSDGDDIKTKGIVTVGIQVFEDVCTGTVNVKEYTCFKNASSSSIKTCSEGYNCQSGKCVNLPRTCSDTETGQGEFASGLVRVDYGTSTKDFSDSCFDDSTVLEYFCSGSNVSSNTIACPSGSTCIAGVCSASCKDTDGGSEPDIVGKVIITDNSGTSIDYKDECYDASRVREYFCYNGKQNSVFLTCRDICRAGGCVITDTRRYQ